MKRSALLGAFGAVLVTVVACSSESSVGGDENDIAIDKSFEDPAKILPPDFESTLASVISPADVGQAFGLDDSKVPYPDTYWPFLLVDDNTKEKLATNGIDDRWLDKSTPSPLEKFMALASPQQLNEAKAWEKKNHGEDVPGVANWFGHCPGWTAAAMVNPPLQHGVSVKNNGGQIAACSDGEAGCTTFEIGDINALEAEAFLGGPSGFLGARCDTKPEDIPRDEHGRVLQKGCRGLNSGALMVVLANRMKNVKKAAGFVPQAIAIDAQNEFNTEQIWNQPAYRYEVNEAKAISEEEAISATTKPGANRPAKYPHNSLAKGFFKIDVGIKWVQENGPNRKPVSGLLSTKTMRFVAVLELDGDAASPTTRIIGGEYLDDPSADANRLRVPPFVWTSQGVAPDNSRGHNPFVKGSIVQQLVGLATR
jgi:hypothetical protein